MIEVHKRQLEWWKSKLGLSDYVVAWIAFFKGILFGLLTYHFFISQSYYKILTASKNEALYFYPILDYHSLVFNKIKGQEFAIFFFYDAKKVQEKCLQPE